MKRNAIPLGATVTLKTDNTKQEFLVKQVTFSIDGSHGYTLASGTQTYYATEQECVIQKNTKRIGFEIS